MSMPDEMLLNGLWKFTFEDGREAELPVPGCFDVSEAFRWQRGRGSYSRCVKGGGMMELSCGGLGLRAEIFWDGRSIYAETTAYTPFKVRFEAGDEGDHELKIVCDNTLENGPESQFRSFYDFYGFGGIYRDVRLRRLSSTSFDHVQVLPDIASGSIELQVELYGEARAIDVFIDGEKCGTMPGPGRRSFRVPDPTLWSPETPNLHRLRLECPCESYDCRFGLRQIECREGKIFLNGAPLKLAGVNRHDVFPDSGAAPSPRQVLNDLRMIKQAGFNMIRGSHYPQSGVMLDYADELGLLVWDEILGWQNPVESLTDAEFRRRQCGALTRMIRDSVNHPCILLWGFLNEGATNKPGARECVEKLCRTAKELDPTRPVTFATMHEMRDLCLDLADVVSFNTYPAWYSGHQTFLEKSEVTNKIHDLLSCVRKNPALAEKPVLISEIGAGAFIGDHSGRRWSEEYQAQLIECAVTCALDDPRCSGILLWQFCNSPVDDNERIMMRPRGYNNKGLVDEYRTPKLAWKLFPGLLK